MNYYYSPAHLYKITPKEGESYSHVLWAYDDKDIETFHKDHSDDSITYEGEVELTIMQPWYEPFQVLWRTFTYWVKDKGFNKNGSYI